MPVVIKCYVTVFRHKLYYVDLLGERNAKSENSAAHESAQCRERVCCRV